MRRFLALVLFFTIATTTSALQSPATAQSEDGLQVEVGQVRIVPATEVSVEHMSVRLKVSCSGDTEFGDEWTVQVAQPEPPPSQFFTIVLGGTTTPDLGCPRSAWITATVPTHDLITPGFALVHVHNYDLINCTPIDGCDQITRFSQTGYEVEIKPARGP
jgi:hypothetical protein